MNTSKVEIIEDEIVKDIYTIKLSCSILDPLWAKPQVEYYNGETIISYLTLDNLYDIKEELTKFLGTL